MLYIKWYQEENQQNQVDADVENLDNPEVEKLVVADPGASAVVNMVGLVTRKPDLVNAGNPAEVLVVARKLLVADLPNVLVNLVNLENAVLVNLDVAGSLPAHLANFLLARKDINVMEKPGVAVKILVDPVLLEDQEPDVMVRADPRNIPRRSVLKGELQEKLPRMTAAVK